MTTQTITIGGVTYQRTIRPEINIISYTNCLYGIEFGEVRTIQIGDDRVDGTKYIGTRYGHHRIRSAESFVQDEFDEEITGEILDDWYELDLDLSWV